jgi:hypothetical protein
MSNEPTTQAGRRSARTSMMTRLHAASIRCANRVDFPGPQVWNDDLDAIEREAAESAQAQVAVLREALDVAGRVVGMAGAPGVRPSRLRSDAMEATSILAALSDPSKESET